jgi:hypothetical protein
MFHHLGVANFDINQLTALSSYAIISNIYKEMEYEKNVYYSCNSFRSSLSSVIVNNAKYKDFMHDKFEKH